MYSLTRLLKNPRSGFTMVEAMMGFTIGAIILTATTPLLLVAVSTRIYNYQLEQAAQIAQGQINQIQAVMSQGVAPANEASLLPPASAVGVSVSQVGAPDTLVTSVTQRDAVNKALAIDNDGNGSTDFIVQIFRDPGVRFNQGSASGQLAVFRMGVRVYAGVAASNMSGLSTQLSTINFTNGLSQQLNRPLAVAYSEISRSDLKLSLEQYRAYLNSNP